jgi:hypothetical protein
MFYKIRQFVIYIERQNPLNNTSKDLVGINMNIRRGVHKEALINRTESLEGMWITFCDFVCSLFEDGSNYICN